MTEKQKNTLYEATQSRIVNFNEIGIVEPQKTIKTTMIGKGIRIDIYTKNIQDQVEIIRYVKNLIKQL